MNFEVWGEEALRPAVSQEKMSKKFKEQLSLQTQRGAGVARVGRVDISASGEV